MPMTKAEFQAWAATVDDSYDDLATAQSALDVLLADVDATVEEVNAADVEVAVKVQEVSVLMETLKEAFSSTRKMLALVIVAAFMRSENVTVTGTLVNSSTSPSAGDVSTGARLRVKVTPSVKDDWGNPASWVYVHATGFAVADA